MKKIENVVKLSNEILKTMNATKEAKEAKYNNATLKSQMLRSIQVIDKDYKDLFNKMFVEQYKKFTNEKYVEENCCNIEIIIEILEKNLKKLKKHNKLILEL